MPRRIHSVGEMFCCEQTGSRAEMRVMGIEWGLETHQPEAREKCLDERRGLILFLFLWVWGGWGTGRS